MHSLGIIIRKNAEAAGREAAEAVNAGDHEKAEAIRTATLADDRSEYRKYLNNPAYCEAYFKEREHATGARRLA